jgi:hypothetical protein
MRYSAIQICTEEPHSSDIPRTEYDWEFSVYRGAKEELLEDAPEPLGKHHGLLDTNGWKRLHSSFSDAVVFFYITIVFLLDLV